MTSPTRWLLLSLLLSSAAFAGPRLELELGGGTTAWPTTSPLLQARVGLDLFDVLTPSLKVVSRTPWSPADATVGAYFELRAHTRGVVQLTGGVAAGLFSATVSTPGAPVVGEGGLVTVSPPTRLRDDYLADLGLRVKLGPAFVGASVGVAPVQQHVFGTLTVGLALFGD